MKDVAYPKTCPEGRWFHHDPLGCHLPNAVQCKKCPDSGVIRIGSPESCTMYTLCIEGIEIDSECPPGTRFDRSEGRCNLEELVNCDYDSCPINERGLQADPSNCRNYIVCFDGSEISRGECNENLLFDSVLNSCALPENVDCENRPIPNMFLPTAPIINPSSKLSAFIGDVPTVPTAGPRT